MVNIDYANHNMICNLIQLNSEFIIYSINIKKWIQISTWKGKIAGTTTTLLQNNKAEESHRRVDLVPSSITERETSTRGTDPSPGREPQNVVNRPQAKEQ
jgi:hypothetical protein